MPGPQIMPLHVNPESYVKDSGHFGVGSALVSISVWACLLNNSHVNLPLWIHAILIFAAFLLSFLSTEGVQALDRKLQQRARKAFTKRWWSTFAVAGPCMLVGVLGYWLYQLYLLS